MKAIRSLAVSLLAAAFVSAAAPAPPAAPQHAPSDPDIVDAYHYMLGRWLVLRQESLDFKNGFKWNTVIHKPMPGPTAVNPSLDVASSEAWIYVDETSCTTFELPQLTGRYYSVQFVNGWGELMDNVNERRNPKHPYGKFAMCLHGSRLTIPRDVRRLDLQNRKSRVRIRIELGAKPAEAIALQKRITLKATGSPTIPKPVVTFDFTDDKLPGVEAFDRTEAILASEADLNAGMDVPQAQARAVAKAAADPAQRAHIDEVIHKQAIPAFFAAISKLSPEMNGWTRPKTLGAYGGDFLMRSVVNYTDLWANIGRELSTFRAKELDGSQTYVQIFANTALPRHRALYQWSVTALDSAKMQVIPNVRNRYFIGKQSDLKYNADGSLTLAFGPKPPQGIPESNWLPTPAGKKYDLIYRFYGASAEVVRGQYYPPPLSRKE